MEATPSKLSLNGTTSILSLFPYFACSVLFASLGLGFGLGLGLRLGKCLNRVF